MKIILQQDVVKVGREGDIVTVADGFARNYLIPRSLAVAASGGALKSLEARKVREEAKAEQLLAAANDSRAKLEGKTVTIAAKAGAGDRLYGSITAQDVADAIKTSTGVVVDKRKVHLTNPIKAMGTFTVPVKLHRDVALDMTVNVTKAS